MQLEVERAAAVTQHLRQVWAVQRGGREVRSNVRWVTSEGCAQPSPACRTKRPHLIMCHTFAYACRDRHAAAAAQLTCVAAGQRISAPLERLRLDEPLAGHPRLGRSLSAQSCRCCRCERQCNKGVCKPGGTQREGHGCAARIQPRARRHLPKGAHLTEQSFCRLSTSASHSVSPAGWVVFSGCSLSGAVTNGGAASGSGAAAAATGGVAGCCGTWPRSWRWPPALPTAAGALKHRSTRASSAPAVADTRAPFIWEEELCTAA